MTTNDELARLRAAFAAPAVSAIPGKAAISGKSGKAAPEPEACPPSDRIWLAVRGELPPDELREILDHVATCHACAEDWRIAMAFEEESRTAVTTVPVRDRTGLLRHRAWMAVAATILVAFIGFQLRPKPPASFRGDDQAGVQSLVEESLPREAFVLRWTAMPGAEAYNLIVSDSNLALLQFQQEGLTTTSFQVPASLLASLRSGDKVHWTITPVGRGGGLSQPQTFTTILK